MQRLFGAVKKECSFEDRLRIPNDPRLKIDVELSDLEEKDVAKWFKQEI